MIETREQQRARRHPDVSRAQVRRSAFNQAFARMPLWETWATTDVDTPIGGETDRIRQHCKVIPRRVRRDMARQRIKRGA